MASPASSPRPLDGVRHAVVSDAWRTILRELGYDLADPHLADSPDRVARFMLDWHTADGHAPEPACTSFPNGKYDEVVVVGDLPFHSLCAHHGAPFWGTAAVGYLPGEQQVGLSKLARIVDHHARKFQTQERLTNDIADHVERALQPRGVAVVLRAEHMCMSMRGIRKPGHHTTTSDLRGAFRENPAARAEFFSLARAR